MKRFLYLAMLCLAGTTAVRACDVCGCSASNQYLGILPRPDYNFIGLQYQYAGFHSAHPSLFDRAVTEHGSDRYHTAQVWGRYHIGSRLQLFAFVPYRLSTSAQEGGVLTARNGFGDVSVLANAVIVRERDTGSGLRHQLIAGAGLKLPTGAYTGITAADRQGLPNLQPGTGAWDVLVNANYTVRKGRWGLNADAAYTLTTANRAGYKYGNRLSSGLMLFHTTRRGRLTVLPQAGLRLEYALHDYDDYARRWLNRQSGGRMCFAAAGLQAYYGKVGARLTYQLPVAQHYGGGYVTATRKVDAGLFFLF